MVVNKEEHTIKKVRNGIIGRLFSLQINESNKYLTLSDKNRLRESRLPPIRGEFKDYFARLSRTLCRKWKKI